MSLILYEYIWEPRAGGARVLARVVRRALQAIGAARDASHYTFVIVALSAHGAVGNALTTRVQRRFYVYIV